MTVAFIVSSLEEREREETFRLKWLKTKMTKRKPTVLSYRSIKSA